jgi:membrane protease YdiL (CAAX protease family)
VGGAPWAASRPRTAMLDYYREGARGARAWRDIARTISAIIMISFATYLAVCLFTLLYGIGIVSPELEFWSFTLYVVFLGVYGLVTLSGGMLYGWYLFLVFTIILSAAWVFLTSARGFGKELTMKSEPRSHSPFFDMCGLMVAILFINTVIVLAMVGIGGEATNPTEDVETSELLLLLANASVWEELIVRVLLIGIPLLVIDAVAKRGFRKPHKYLLGGGIAIGRPEVFLIVVSSIIFGLAHLEGWGAWKVFPSGLAGVAFGYMYLKHGLAASILLHFSFDYLSMPLLVFEGSLSLALAVGIGILLWLGLGLVFATYFTIRIAEFLTGKTLFDSPGGTPVPAPAGAPYTQSQQWSQHSNWTHAPPTSDDFFICPICGSTGARRLQGRRQCRSCGRLFE